LTNVRYGSTAELQAFNQVFCYGSTGTGKTVNVTVAGTTPTDLAFLTLGTAFTTSSFGSTPPFTNVPDGTIDLIGARASISGTAIALNKLFITRGISPAANSTVAVDFNGTGSLDPIVRTITLTNLGTDQGLVSAAYMTANRSYMTLNFDLPGTSTTRSVGGFPTFAGSFHLIQGIAYNNFPSFDRFRGAAVIYAAMENRTLNLGPELGAVTVTSVATSPSLRLQAVIPTATYNQSWSASFSQGSAASARTTSVQSTAAYVGTVPATVTLAVPDLSGVAGFQAIWGLADVSTNWTAQAQAISGFGSGGQWQDGASFLVGARLGAYAPEQQE
jgi:hypothetical protein